MINKNIPNQTEKILIQVGDLSEQLAKRAKSINFEVEKFSNDEITDLRMYLGYTKSFSDLAKVRLLYHKAQINGEKENKKS